MNFLSGLAKGGDSKDKTGEEKSSSDLFDKGKAAGACADLLDAASDYGKLDGTTGVGKYVDQAEGYLRQYSNSSTPAPPAPAAAEIPKKAEEVLDKPAEGGAGDYIKKAKEFLNKPTEGGGEAAGGAGDYIKKAEEFLSKPSDGGEKGESEGGYGGVLKAAGGFFDK